MKKPLLFLIFLGIFLSARAQEKSYDTLAVVVLDHMSALIGDLTSVQFRLQSESDQIIHGIGTVTTQELSHVWFSGPDKLLVEIWGNKGHRGFWYNSQTLTWYSFTENNYVVIDVPDKTIDMIDSIHSTYGIDFPAADFFYPTFTDDLIAWSDFIAFQGRTNIDGQSCYQIVAINQEMTVQIWVSDEVLCLPLKMVIVYHGDQPLQRYEATFSDWQLNPDLPNGLFDFALPPGAHQVSILPRK